MQPLFKQLNKLTIFEFVILNKLWPKVKRFKKHVAIDHCRSFELDQTAFRKKWFGVSGIYKITFLPLPLFSYYGSSRNIGERLKYHFYNGRKRNTFLGLFISIFGWKSFSVTIIERCPAELLQSREDWYLDSFYPLLNYLPKSYSDGRNFEVSSMTRLKISAALKGRTWSLESKEKRKLSISGKGHYNYGKSLPLSTLDAAALALGKPIFVYKLSLTSQLNKNLVLVNNNPFRSIREAAKHLPISPVSLSKYLDTDKPFKGYLYYSASLDRQNNTEK